MKKNHGVLFGFAVLLITAMFVLVGCGDSDNGSNTGSENNTGADTGYLGTSVELKGQVYKENGSPYTYTGTFKVYAYSNDPPAASLYSDA
jgi:hypothetical protein